MAAGKVNIKQSKGNGKCWPAASNITSVGKQMIFSCGLAYVSHSVNQSAICKSKNQCLVPGHNKSLQPC